MDSLFEISRMSSIIVRRELARLDTIMRFSLRRPFENQHLAHSTVIFVRLTSAVWSALSPMSGQTFR